VRLLYFAWVRERVGVSQESLACPPGVTTAGELMTWLAQRSEGHARAFAEPSRLRVAVNQVHVARDAAVSDRDEVAFFPPVTGG
jgi:molybdopterin synthase sulfur carrier subunit